MISFQELNERFAHEHLLRRASYAKFRQIHRQFFEHWVDHPTKLQIRKWHIEHEGTPAHANKALAFLKAMYAWAIKQELCQDNPATGICRHQTFGRERTLSQREAAALMNALSWMFPKLSLLLLILITTGCRLTEALNMEWAHLNLEIGAWTKPRTKNGRPQRIPLPRQTCLALSRFQQAGAYVFMGMYEHRWSRTGAEKMWASVRAKPELALEDVWLHDFRRTVSNRLRRQGEHPFVVNKILNHYSKDITEKHYNYVDFDEQAEALQKLADWLFGLIRKEEHHVDSPAVVPCASVRRAEHPAPSVVPAVPVNGADHGHPVGTRDHELLGHPRQPNDGHSIIAL